MFYSLKEISHGKRGILSLLMPYWGIMIDEDDSQIKGALSSCSVFIKGLSDTTFRKLSRLLEHTEIQLNPNNGTPLKIVIEKNDNNTAPITLKTNTAAFYLKPLRKKTQDVQTWIHKRLWLPVKEPALTILIHPREEKNIPEWLFYLIIQYYMQSSFESLSKIKFADYNLMVSSVLNDINEDLAHCQLSITRMGSQNWPELPPNSNQKNEEDPPENPIQPFRDRISKPEGKKLNPFARKQTISNKHTINPFKNKNNPHSP